MWETMRLRTLHPRSTASSARPRATSLVAVLALLALAAVTLPRGAAAAEDRMVFGAYPGERGGSADQGSVLAFEQDLGRPLEAVRVYDLWDQPFPSSYDRFLRDGGRYLVLSVKPKRMNGSKITWRSIADAVPGSARYQEIVGWAQKIAAFGAPISFTFHHEPEAHANVPYGVDRDFIDAWRKVVTVFRQEGVTNAEFTWIMTDYAFWIGDRRDAPLWYPGDAYVDNIAADSYNWFECRPGIINRWKPLSETLDPLRRFGLLHPDKPLWVTEFAGVEDPNSPGRKASWLGDVRALFKAPGWDQFQMILYYHHLDPNHPGCQWYADSSQSSWNAYAAMGADPFYTGTPPPPPPPPDEVFQDGFETGGLSKWTATSKVTVASGGAQSGTFAARAVGSAASGSWARKVLSQGYDDLVVGSGVKLHQRPASSANLMKLYTPGGVSLFHVGVDADGDLLLRNNLDGTTRYSTARLAVGSWYEVELDVHIAGASSSVDVLLDGALVGSLALRADLGTQGIAWITIGDSTKRAFDVSFDEVVAAEPA